MVEVPRIESVNHYYKCSREAYNRKDALRVLSEWTTGNLPRGPTSLVEKQGPFGWFSKFPKDLRIHWVSEKPNCEEELTKFKKEMTKLKSNDNKKL
jgi:hypothetical protein